MVQLYLSGPPFAGAPSRSLKGFERVRLRPGEEKQLSFTLTARDLGSADEQGTMRVRPGRYRLWIGGGQPGTGLPGAAAFFDVKGTVALPR